MNIQVNLHDIYIEKKDKYIYFKFYLHLGRTMMRLSYCVGLAYVKGIVHQFTVHKYDDWCSGKSGIYSNMKQQDKRVHTASAVLTQIGLPVLLDIRMTRVATLPVYIF